MTESLIQPQSKSASQWDETGAAIPFAVTVVMPAYNEAAIVGRQIEDIRRVMDATGVPYEFIVVDDGSTDGTADVVRQHDVRLIAKKYNRGYGAALKSGISVAKYDWILITDADGTYPVEDIPRLLAATADYDMVVAARTGENVQIPLIRRPAKWVLARMANYLARQPIPDLNSGMRIFRKSLAERFEHLFPSGFSFTTTITMASLLNEYRVHYLSINYHKRVGSSKIRFTHAYEFMLVILRTAVYFNPLRIFLPLGALWFLAGAVKIGFDVFHHKISSSAVIAILGALILWGVGLISDQISRIGPSTRRK